MSTIQSLHRSLKTEWKKKTDLKTIEGLSEKLKTLLAESLFIPTVGDDVSVANLIITREVLEIGVQFSVVSKDIPAFERYMYDYKKIIGESPEM